MKEVDQVSIIQIYVSNTNGTIPELNRLRYKRPIIHAWYRQAMSPSLEVIVFSFQVPNGILRKIASLSTELLANTLSNLRSIRCSLRFYKSPCRAS